MFLPFHYHSVSVSSRFISRWGFQRVRRVVCAAVRMKYRLDLWEIEIPQATMRLKMKKTLQIVCSAAVLLSCLACSEGEQKKEGKVDQTDQNPGVEAAQQIKKQINMAKDVQQLSHDRLENIDNTAREKE